MSSINYDQLRADAAAEVANELDAIKDPFERRTRTEEIRDQAYMEMSVLKPERDQLVAAVALYEPRALLYEEFGISYLSMKRIASIALGTLENQLIVPAWPKDRAKAARDAGIPYTPGVSARAAELAAKYEAAEARRNAAVTLLEPAQEAVRTAGGRREVGAIDRPDFEKIREEATREVNAEFATLAAGPEERLRLAAETVDQGEEEMAILRAERDKHANSLAFYTTARGIDLSAGITRQGLIRVQRRALGLPRDGKLPARPEQPAAARAAGVEFVKNADKELPQIAAAHEAARARHAAAVKIRNAAIQVLHAEPYGWDGERIAEFIDRHFMIVYRVLKSPAE
ncbi:hypothetical protein ACWDZ4_20230 [Streptomyces sp. NPDC003016]